MGYGLGGAGASAFNAPGATSARSRVMGDGGFWHNGLTSGVGNAVFNKSDNVHHHRRQRLFGGDRRPGHPLLAAPTTDPRARSNPIETAVRGVGVKWVRTITRTYDVARMRDTLREALTTPEKGPKVIVAQSECMLNKQRRIKPLAAARRSNDGKRVVRERFGVDADTCTGDHSCIRLSGCPSLTIAPNPDPLRTRPGRDGASTAASAAALCGEVAHAAVLCPSFYKRRDRQQPDAAGTASERAARAR